MAGTVHSDPYSIFLRRIGYSVGLEATLERFKMLVESYLERRDVTIGSWRDIVRSQFGLTTDNIADVFFSLRFIQRTQSDVLVLENLDAAALMYSQLEGENEREEGLKFILLWAILVNDGEIFLNLLKAGFDNDLISSNLDILIRRKREALQERLPNRDALRKAARVVTIERQETNVGGGGTGPTIKSLRRTEPLQSAIAAARRDEGDPMAISPIALSPDYFRKVPPKRREWARSLGLWDEDKITARGDSFCRTIASLGYGDDEVFVFWPMDFELVRSGMRPDLLGEPKTIWEALCDFERAFSGQSVSLKSPGTDTDQLVETLFSMHQVFRTLNMRKAMLRNEIPVTVAYLAIVATAYAKGKWVMDVPSLIEEEQRSLEPRLSLRRSRLTGAAISMVN